MIEAVFDTNTFLQAAASENGPADACWQFVEQKKVNVFVTEAILSEVEDVLNRPKIRLQFSRLTVEHTENMLRTFRNQCQFIDNPVVVFELRRDNDDAKFVDLAAATGASFIVTRDRDLLDLMDESGVCNKFPALKIVTPVGFLEIVRKA